MAYDKKDFEAVVESADILSEIEARIGKMKRAGSSSQACCPFHTDKTPSFTVSPTKKIWKCFGCSESGDIISFVARYDNISQMDAMRKLAAIYNVTISEQKTKEEGPDDRQIAATALKIAQVTFESALLHNRTVKRYVVGRGINTAELVKHWGLGYADENYNLEADKTAMELAGLIRNEKLFFRNRIMFPITDYIGRIVGFGGRDIAGHSKAKYINTPDTILYNKSEVLYGLRQALPRIKQTGIVIIAEGYFDVILLHQIKGLDCAVAPCGTSLTKSHAAMLAKYAGTACLMFDGDTAGKRANIFAIESLFFAGFKEVQVTIFPEGVDPADLALDSGLDLGTFKDNVVDTVSAMEYLITYLEEPQEQKVQKILNIISNCPSPLRRDSLVRELSDLVAYDQYVLTDELSIIMKKKAWA